MKKYGIGIWGQFGDGVNKIADGQAVRTTIMTKELKMRYGEKNIGIVNTNNWKKHPISFFLKTVRLFFKSEAVAILPADGGFKVIVPLYDFLQKIKKKTKILEIIKIIEVLEKIVKTILKMKIQEKIIIQIKK